MASLTLDRPLPRGIDLPCKDEYLFSQQKTPTPVPRFFDPAGRLLLSKTEAEAQRAEVEAQRATAAEQRAAALEAELARLKAQQAQRDGDDSF